MDFNETLDCVREQVRTKRRVSYRALKRQFGLADDYLEDLTVELIKAERVAADEGGEILVWVGDASLSASPSEPHSQPPAGYTPQHLAERILAEQSAMESRGAANGERKTITALFADLKGSTALIEGLDPEDARAIIDPALQLMMDAVHRYDGYVAQALGDGIFALFGAPIAHEDHPQRALYAALRMQEEMRAYADQSRLTGGIPLQMRVGINTGEVVVRSIRKDDLHTDYVPVGHSTNLAARMEQLATPGSIVISEYTQKLTEGYFELKALGAADIKGVEEPLNVYEVLGAGPLRTRLQVSARRGMTRFVGRQTEQEQMSRALEQAKAGHGQVVGVMGEPGLGKSRLFYEFKLIARSGCRVLETCAVSYGKASPYLPLVDLLKTYFQLDPSDDERTRQEKITGRVLTLDRSLEDTLPYLFSLLSIENQTSHLPGMDAQIRRQRTFAALKKLFLRESLNQPLILIVEDLHWIDAETQGFLDALSDSVPSAPLLLLVNYRPEYRHDWAHKTYYTQLRLAPLGKGEAEELLTFLLGNDNSLPELKQRVLERTEGTPFFMEEVVQTLVEEGTLIGERGQYHLTQTPTELYISSTVQGVLAARIDRLSTKEKTLLQQLSIIGRQFPLSLVKQVVPQSEDDLYPLLASLQAKEFLYEQPAFPEVEYVFKHALSQEVAYGTVLHAQRKALHEQTAAAIETHYADRLDEQYAALAYHYSRSKNTHKAVEYLGLAGQQAALRSAYEEAIRSLTSGLELLRDLPDTSERMQQELSLSLALGPAFIASEGFTSPEAEVLYRRVRTLCRQADAQASLAPALYGLQVFHLVLAEYQTGKEFAELLFPLAEQTQDQAILCVAYQSVGAILTWLGDLATARQYQERSITLYDELPDRSVMRAFPGSDPKIAARSYSVALLWLQGYPGQALLSADKAVTEARSLSNPHSLIFGLYWQTWVQSRCGESHTAQESARAVITLGEELGSQQWVSWGRILLGKVLINQGTLQEGLAQLQEGLDSLQTIQTHWARPHFLSFLAEAHAKIENVAEGLTLLTEASDIIQHTQERWCEAEIYRLRGELLLKDERRMMNNGRKTHEAETCFQQAIEIAQQQEAKSWELRAATSLARLWQQQGKRAEARELLAPVYEWFTEGFDTADLKDAKALLATLSEGV